MIQYNRDLILDCYQQRQDASCKLSFANSYVRALCSKDAVAAQQNVRIVVNVQKKYAALKTIKKVKAHEELFTDYGPTYEHVTMEPLHLTGDSLPSSL